MYANNFIEARIQIDKAINYSLQENNHNIFAIAEVIAIRDSNIQDAYTAFQNAIANSDEILSRSPQIYDAISAKALALAGLAICENSREYAQQAIEAYRAARAITSAAGIVARVLKLFDALAVADTNGVLAGVREAVEGK